MKSLRHIFEKNNDLNFVSKIIKQKNIGMISASRGEFSPEENEKRTSSLMDDINSKKLDYIPVRGRYIENYGSKDEKPVDEKSFLIHSDENIIHHLKNFGKKYGQDSVLYKEKNSEIAKLHGTNKSGFPGLNKSHDIGTFHPNKKGEVHTVLGSGETFNFS